MTTNISFTFDSTVIGTFMDVFALSDDDAQRLVDAYQVLFTKRLSPIETGPTPTVDETIHKLNDMLWQQIKQTVEQYYQKLAAIQATASVKSVTATQTQSTKLSI